MGKVLKNFQISGKLRLYIDVNIKAESLEDVIKQAEELKVLDFVEIKDEYIDGDLKIIGAYDMSE